MKTGTLHTIASGLFGIAAGIVILRFIGKEVSLELAVLLGLLAAFCTNLAANRKSE